MLLSLVLVSFVLYFRFTVMFYFQNFPFLCTSYSNNWLKQVKRKLSAHTHKGISMVSDIKYFPDLPIEMESSPRLQNLDLSPTSDKKCTGGRYDVSGWVAPLMIHL